MKSKSIEVLITAGDRVSAEDPLITLESDKATMDIPAPEAGEITKLLVDIGQMVSAGTPIALMTTGDSDLADTSCREKTGGQGSRRPRLPNQPMLRQKKSKQLPVPEQGSMTNIDPPQSPASASRAIRHRPAPCQPCDSPVSPGNWVLI